MHEPVVDNGALPPASPGAFEFKIDLPPDLAPALVEWAQTRLARDPHAGPSGSYRVHSVYFDTTAQDVSRRTPGFRKLKYRVRRYGDEALVYLEEKRRVRDFVTKRRSSLRIDQLGEAMHDAQHWFVTRLRERDLVPACAIAYERLALVGSSGSGPLRLTLDRRMQCAAAPSFEFEPLVPPVAMPISHMILELKFAQSLPSLFKELLAAFRLAPAPISKYRLAVEQMARRNASLPPA